SLRSRPNPTSAHAPCPLPLKPLHAHGGGRKRSTPDPGWTDPLGSPVAVQSCEVGSPGAVPSCGVGSPGAVHVRGLEPDYVPPLPGVSTILPNCCPASSRSCASRARTRSHTTSTTGCSAPENTSAMTSLNSLRFD